MTPHVTGLFIGGVLAAALFGLTNVLTKISSQANISIGPFLLAAGIGVVVTGATLLGLQSERIINIRSGLFAFGAGIFWASAMGCVTYSIIRYHIPISQTVPLHALGVIVSVATAFLLFSEWREVDVPKLVFGIVLLTAGSILVGQS